VHCHILLSTFTTVYVPTQNINLFSSSFQHFKIERITTVSKARLKVPVKDALIAYEFHSLLFARMSVPTVYLLKALRSFKTSGTVTQGTATIPHTDSCHPGVVCFATGAFSELRAQ
jgi:hypothetical protein